VNQNICDLKKDDELSETDKAYFEELTLPKHDE